MRDITEFPIIENHLRGYFELMNNYTENRSIASVDMVSTELEMCVSSDLLRNSEVLRLIDNESIVIKGDNSLTISDFYPSEEGVSYADQRSENSYIENCYQIEYGNGLPSENILRRYDWILGEIVIQKQRRKEALRIIELLWKLGIKTDKGGQNSGHIHTSATKKEGIKKFNTPSFINAFCDFHDNFTFKYNIKNIRGYLNRVYGNNRFAYRGNNIKSQLKVYREMALRNTSYFTDYPQQRYFALNCCMDKVKRHSRKKFGTIENRLAPVFREGWLQIAYLGEYLKFQNKFLEFYKDISSEVLAKNLLYKRVNQQKYVKNDKLENAFCLDIDTYCDRSYGTSDQYVNFNIQPSLSINENLAQLKEELIQ